jgi:tocopherol cyclase
VELDIDRDGVMVRGKLAFGPWRPWPVSVRQPGIMGWYRFVPRMECYHGVISFDHELSGTLDIDGTSVDFARGRGYAEKDWGRSFPSSWVWAQSNHFSEVGTSVQLSVARIPWMGGSFVGFIAGVLIGEELYRFATYTGARLTAFSSRPGGAQMAFEDRTHRLEAEVDAANPAPLRAPVHGRMVARADEAIDARIKLKLTRLRDGAVLLDDTGLHAGVEVMDQKQELAAGVFHPLAADD